MKLAKKIKVLISMVVLFITFKNSYAITQAKAGEIIAQFAINFFDNYASETIYSLTNWTNDNSSHRAYAYRGEKTSGMAQPSSGMISRGTQPVSFSNKYGMDCVGFVSFCIHQSLGLGSDTTFTYFVTPQSGAASGVFKKVTDGTRKPGDILATSGHVAVYIGNGEVIDSAAAGPNREITRRAKASVYPLTYRISDSSAAGINESDTTVQFQGKGTAEYSFSSEDIGGGNISKNMILSGTAPGHWENACRDFSEYFSWTNVSYADVVVQGETGESSTPSSGGESSFMPGDENTVTTMAGTFPKYRQGGSEVWASWIFYDKTLKDQACGPTSLSIILSGLGLVIPGYDGASLKGKTNEKDGVMTPPEVCAFSLAVGGHVPGAGMSWAFPNKLMQTLNIEVVEFNGGEAQKVLDLLKQGYTGMASASTGYFTGGGHMLAVVGANPDDDGQTIGIVDPATSTRDGFYTVSQLNGTTQMPSGKGSGGRTNANIVHWWVFKYKNS